MIYKEKKKILNVFFCDNFPGLDPKAAEMNVFSKAHKSEINSFTKFEKSYVCE